jgi:hypothetical protein
MKEQVHTDDLLRHTIEALFPPMELDPDGQCPGVEVNNSITPGMQLGISNVLNPCSHKLNLTEIPTPPPSSTARA